MKSLEDLCLTSYLCFLETECKAWIDITSSGSLLLQVQSTQYSLCSPEGRSLPCGAQLERPPCCIPQRHSKLQPSAEDVRRDHQWFVPKSSIQKQCGRKLPGSTGKLWSVREFPPGAPGCHSTQCPVCPSLLYRSFHCRGHVKGKCAPFVELCGI